MCHQTLKSFRRAVQRMPYTLMKTCGIMMSTITKSWKYQFVAEPKTGTCASAGRPAIRVTAPIR